MAAQERKGISAPARLSLMWFFPQRSIASELRRLAFRMSRPHAVRVSLIYQQEFDMALIYEVTAGPAVDSDVAIRRVIVTVNGEVSSTTEHPKDATSFGEVSVPQDASVVVTLVDIDDAGNESQPAFIEFTAKDTIAPAQPGALGATLVREE